MQERGSASLCQYYFAFTQILAGRKREQLALAQSLDIAHDGAGIAIEHASEGFHCRRAEVMHHHEQAELRNPQASSGQRGIISLCDSARRRAHRQTNTIAALVQFRKLSAPHVCSLSLAASAHNLVPEDRRLTGKIGAARQDVGWIEQSCQSGSDLDVKCQGGKSRHLFDIARGEADPPRISQRACSPP